jgi:hypothetical protein
LHRVAKRQLLIAGVAALFSAFACSELIIYDFESKARFQ